MIDIRKPLRRVTVGATPGQKTVLSDPARFITLVTGRRWGKTTLGVLRIISRIVTPKAGGLIWWVAPTYRQARKPFRMITRMMRATPLIREVHKGDMAIDLRTGWRIEFRSFDQPDNLRGEGLDELIVDEYGLMDEPTWDECLRPMLLDRQGGALMIGTPKGKGTVMHKTFEMGRTSSAQDYSAHTFSSADSPFIPASEIEHARATLSKRAFAQEILGTFVDAGGTVFEDVRARRGGVLGEVGFDDGIAIGVDWAKTSDYTFFCADSVSDGHTVAVKRIKKRGISYVRQVEILKEFVEDMERMVGEGNVTVLFDKTGVGVAVEDIIEEHDVPGDPEGFVFTERSKRELVEELVVDFESGLTTLPLDDGDEDLDVMIRELETFALEVSPSGRISYGAPVGLHDDAACAKMLANRARHDARRLSRSDPVPQVVTL